MHPPAYTCITSFSCKRIQYFLCILSGLIGIERPRVEEGSSGYHRMFCFFQSFLCYNPLCSAQAFRFR